jgi:hypothetical protein
VRVDLNVKICPGYIIKSSIRRCRTIFEQDPSLNLPTSILRKKNYDEVEPVTQKKGFKRGHKSFVYSGLYKHRPPKQKLEGNV